MVSGRFLPAEVEKPQIRRMQTIVVMRVWENNFAEK